MKIKLSLSAVFLLSAFFAGAFPVEGVIYLKEGGSVSFSGDDRICIPKTTRDVKAYRNAFARSKQKEVYAMANIDSIVCWHPRTPEYRRKFIPAEGVGWCWVYFQAPRMCAYIYAGKGYDIGSNGGIRVWQRRGMFSRSKVAYYLQKQGDAACYSLGKIKAGKAFRERICRYVADDAALCERIRSSNTWCDKTVLMLQEYNPGN